MEGCCRDEARSQRMAPNVLPRVPSPESRTNNSNPRPSHGATQVAAPGSSPFAPPPARDDHVPHVIAWNLTRRCNLECAHCYIAAGPSESADGELSTAECRRIADEILAL